MQRTTDVRLMRMSHSFNMADEGTVAALAADFIRMAQSSLEKMLSVQAGGFHRCETRNRLTRQKGGTRDRRIDEGLEAGRSDRLSAA